MRRISAKSLSSGGFTMMELVIGTAVIGMLTVMTLETMRVYVPRFELRQGANSVAQLINRARIMAIQRGVTTVVRADFEARTVTAFADVNGSSLNPLAPGALYLVYDPDLLLPEDRTDFLIGTLLLPGKLKTGVQFGGPLNGLGGADSVRGFTQVPIAAPDEEEEEEEEESDVPNVLVFQPNGSTRGPGGFRLMDARGENFLEVAVVTIVGKVELRKYLLAEDAPTGIADFFPEGNISFDDDAGPGKHIWVWY
jgi:hypothetical protein